MKVLAGNAARRRSCGRLTEKWLLGATAGGVNTRYAYNDDNTLQSILNRTYGGAVISHNDYTYDPVGNRKTATEKAGAYTTPPLSEAYGYDPLGNRSYKSDGSATFYYVHDAANQLKEVRLNTPTGPLSGALIYDAHGNLIQKCEGGTVTTSATACTGTTVTTLSHDAYNRLVQVQKTGLATQSYQYDHQGRRISKTAGAATTHYLYNGDNIHAEYTAWSAAAASYTHGPGTDDPLIRATPTTNQYYHKDGLGSIVAMTDSNSATTGTQLYDAWGNKLAVTASGTIAQYGYTGREPDETGLIYYRARYYDPSVGRFTQRDPSGFNGGLNLYAYVGGNPINATDPTGLRIFIIPGTNISGKREDDWWSSPKSAFATTMKKLTGDEQVFPVKWDGEYSDLDRMKTAATLAYETSLVPPHEPVYWFGHSEGGNVAAIASQWINRTVNLAVTMGTPMHEEYVFDDTYILQGIALGSPNDWTMHLFGNGGSRTEPGWTNVSSTKIGGHSDYWKNPQVTSELIGEVWGPGPSIGPTNNFQSGSATLPNPIMNWSPVTASDWSAFGSPFPSFSPFEP